MSDREHERLSEIFVAACALDPQERAAYLDAACAGDTSLRREVEELLALDDGATGRLMERVAAGDEPPERPGSAEVPSEVGPFRILRRLGTGGMAEVYEAEQREPVLRRVALKLIKPGMDTREVIARFESERQALALMDHNNIAQVYDGGLTESGRPYFAMEYVRGVAITDYCDRYKLDLKERLELFLRVCEGVEHAHQKGIIHRDLKPSNILVAVQGERPVPKIIDFGIAKATAQQLAESALRTELGALIGTPAYMSPEQADYSPLEVDTRTDIYSLGVVLYELLTGSLPFEPQSRGLAGSLDLRQMIREQEPPRPSARVTPGGEATVETARLRGVERGTLRRQLRDDLDWIVLKCLEKDRTRRYGYASELAGDIRRHLRHEPVLAGPPSAIYRSGKFIRRHRVGVAAAVVTSLALLGGILATSWSLVRARRAEAQMRVESQTNREVLDFLVDLFAVSDPSEARGNSITAREILDRGAEEVVRELEEQPQTQARLMSAIGTVYQGLGLYREAGQMLEGAFERRQRSLGLGHPEVARSQRELALLYRLQGRLPEAQRLFEAALASYRAAGDAPPAELAEVLSGLGGLNYHLGDYETAIAQYRQALEIRERELGVDHPEVARSLRSLGVVHWRQGDFDRAESYLKRALDIREAALGEDHPDVAASLEAMAVLYGDQGRFAEAEPYYRRSLAIREKVLGPDHPDLATSLNNLAVFYRGQGRLDDAEPLLERAASIYEQALGEDNTKVAGASLNLALLYADQGRSAEAEALCRRALAINRKALPEENSQRAEIEFVLARSLAAQSRWREAERTYLSSVVVFEHSVGATHADIAYPLHGLANLYRDVGRSAEAARSYERALDLRRDALPPTHLEVRALVDDYAAFLRSTGDPEAAEQLEASFAQPDGPVAESG